MSECRLPRNIAETVVITPVSASISISGNYYSSNYGYVNINGTKYTSNATFNFTIPPDSPQIVVYCSAQSASYQANCQITLDGAVVQSGAGSYTFTADKSYTITLTRSGVSSSNRYWRAAIVTVS